MKQGMGIGCLLTKRMSKYRLSIHLGKLPYSSRSRLLTSKEESNGGMSVYTEYWRTRDSGKGFRVKRGGDIQWKEKF